MQTITHRVRTFLRQQGAAIEPWSGLDATYSELYALLDRRRHDPALWQPLEGLLREILRRAADPVAERRLATPAAELLSSWDAAELVASLRKALSDTPPSDAPLGRGGREYRRLTRQLSPSVLGAFLVLGLAAAGCASNDGEPGGTRNNGNGGTGSTAMDSSGTGGLSTGGVSTGGVSTGGVSTGGVSAGGVTTGGVTTGGVSTGGGGAASGGTAGAGMGEGGLGQGGLGQGGLGQGGLGQGGLGQGGVGGGTGVCMIDDAEVLASTINDSTLDVASKSDLCTCMTQLSESWRDGLTSLFETGTAEQIAIALEEMLVCCSEGRTSGTFSQNALLQGTLCEPFYGTGGVYKGVSFPD